MQKIFTGLILMGSISSFACEFQSSKSDLVKANKIKCNEDSRVATIEDPKIEIEGKFYNMGAIYGVEMEYWDTDTRNYNSRNKETRVIERTRKTRVEGRAISQRSRDQICNLFGFSRSVELEHARIFSYFKKAYSFDHDELGYQSLYYAPISNIKCK